MCSSIATSFLRTLSPPRLLSIALRMIPFLFARAHRTTLPDVFCHQFGHRTPSTIPLSAPHRKLQKYSSEGRSIFACFPGACSTWRKLESSTPSGHWLNASTIVTLAQSFQKRTQRQFAIAFAAPSGWTSRPIWPAHSTVRLPLSASLGSLRVPFGGERARSRSWMKYSAKD